MDTLVVINSIEEFERSVAYALRVTSEQDAIHLRAIIPVQGDVPTKRNGQVLEVCTEFNLSGYYQEQAAHQTVYDDLDKNKAISSFQALIGNYKAIVHDQVAALKPDLVMTASELSTETKDLIRHTHAGELRAAVDLPVLTYKCDRSMEAITHIALVSDFSEQSHADLRLVKHIAKKSKADIALYTFIDKAAQHDEVESMMDRCIAENELGAALKVILQTDDKEKSVRDLLLEYPINLIVLTDMHRHGLKKILLGDLENDILNHTAIPILVL